MWRRGSRGLAARDAAWLGRADDLGSHVRSYTVTLLRTESAQIMEVDMAKLIASLGALLLFSSFGVTSVGGSLRNDPLSATEPLDGEAHTGADVGMVAELTDFDPTVPVVMGEMSDEEKERRRDACVRMFEACEDRCASSKKRGANFRICRERCVNSLANCMKKVPY